MSVCRSCGAEVIWVVTDRGKRMPLDAETREMAYGFEVKESGKATFVRLRQPGPLRKSHFATCPNANEHRRVRS